MNYAQAAEMIDLLRAMLVKISAIERRLETSPFVGRPIMSVDEDDKYTMYRVR